MNKQNGSNEKYRSIQDQINKEYEQKLKMVQNEANQKLIDYERDQQTMSMTAERKRDGNRRSNAYQQNEYQEESDGFASKDMSFQDSRNVPRTP